MLRQGGRTLLNRINQCSKGGSLASLSPAEPSYIEPAASVSSWLMKAWQGSQATFHSSPQPCIQSTGKPPENEAASEAATAEAARESASTSAEAGPESYADLKPAELQQLLIERDGTLKTSLAQVDDLTDHLKRTLADMENLRQRSARAAEQTKKFAVQGFLKSMLDVGDNLERAYSTVPQQALEGLDKDGKPLSTESAVKLLTGLVNGVKLTEKIFDQGLKANSVEKIRPLGEKFDPNQHEALFEMPDPTKEPGTVGAITKTGYLLQGRVVRPAQVGVYKKP